MNFKKENLKEVYTSDKVSDVVVFQKGTNVPQIIKAENLGDRTKGYFEYVALLSQSDTNPPVSIVLKNTLPNSVSIQYTIAGKYKITSQSFTENKTFVLIGQASSGNGIAVNYAYPVSFPDISIETYVADVAEDGLLFNTPIEIRVYP